jgi:23S rRNA pseudouridine955/2504/2580 synthase
MMRHLTVDLSHVGQRLDNFLYQQLKGLPKSCLYRLIRKGVIRVNKKRVKPSYRLNHEDSIKIPELNLTQPVTKIPKIDKSFKTLLNNSIIFENEDLVVLNKPSGLAVHGGSHIQFGLAQFLKHLRPDCSLELAHRLDKDTSGCLLFAKNTTTLKQLHHLFKTNQVKKYYLALVIGRWPSHLKKIDIAIHKGKLRSGERMVCVDEYGKSSITQFKSLRYFPKTNVTLIAALPQTGRTHQIRVHTQYAHHPIVGDQKYGDAIANGTLRKLGCKHLCLHAQKISFTLPEKKLICVEAKLPDDFQSCLNHLS